jgi:hypothetical protein
MQQTICIIDLQHYNRPEEPVCLAETVVSVILEFMETLKQVLWANKHVVMVSLFHADGRMDGRTDMISLTVAFHSSFCKRANKRFRWSRGSVLAFGTQVRGFTPGRNLRIFRAEKNLQHAFLRSGSKAVGPM